MKLQNIKLSLIRDNNTEGIKVIEKIQKYVKQYNISINKAITFLLSNYQSQYQKRILDICRAVYPYDGEINLNDFLKSNKANVQNDISIIHKIGKYKNSENRIKHYQDEATSKINIGVLAQSTLANNINKKMKIAVEKIQPEFLQKKTKVTKKYKKRID